MFNAGRSASQPADSTGVYQLIEAFEEAWQEGRTPAIEKLLPTEGSLRRAVLGKMLHIDLENRLRAGETARVENYVDRFPELTEEATILLDLIAWEFTLRRRTESELTTEEYRRRFPRYASELDSRLSTEAETLPPIGMPPQGQSMSVSVAARDTVSFHDTSSPQVSSENPSLPGYEILGVLGRGGMGVVYKARQIRANRLVALKMILAGAHAGPDNLARFRTEAEAVARLQHPNIVQIHEVGEHGGLPFFSLEFCAGGSLASQLDGTPWPATNAAQLLETLARAIHAAHERHVIHRDLKPANILLAVASDQWPVVSKENERAKLTTMHWSLTTVPKISDFGLAKKLDDTGDTQSGAVMGTPSYMAPEQAAGKSKDISGAADVYALGVILYELLTGRPPFRGPTPLDTIMQVIADEPVSPRQLQPKVPRDLETICLKCLQKEPHKRYATADALAEDLGHFQAGEPIAARPTSWLERGIKWTRRRPALATLLLVVVLTLAGLSAGAWGYLESEAVNMARRSNMIDRKRSEAQAKLGSANEALKRRDWPAVISIANEGIALVGEEEDLADLHAQAGELRSAAKTVQLFLAHRDTAMYHAVVALEDGSENHRKAVREAAAAGLALFGNRANHLDVSEQVLPAGVRRWLAEYRYEMYLTWANVLIHTSAPSPAEKQGLIDEALELLDRAASLGSAFELSTKSYHQRRAELLRLRGEKDRAASEEKLAAGLEPKLAVDRFLQGLEHNRTGKMEEAAKHFEKVGELQPDHFWAHYCLSGCYLRQNPKRLDGARAALTVCLRLKKESVWPYLLRGLVHGELNDFDAAFRDFETAEKYAEKEFDLYGLRANRAFVRFREGTLLEQQAEKLLKSQEPEGARKKKELARDCYKLALADLQDAIKLLPEGAQAHVTLAAVEERCGNMAGALASLDRAIALAPAPAAKLFRTRARLHEKRSEFERALADLSEAIRSGDTPQKVAGDELQRGLILYELKRYPACLQACERSLEAWPEQWPAHELRGKAHFEMGHFAEAVEAFKRCVQMGSRSALTVRALGLGHFKLKQHGAAAEAFSAALRIDQQNREPTHGPTVGYRAWAYLSLGAFELALADFDKAVQAKDVDLADVRAGRGYAQAKLRNWRAAVDDAEAALKAGPVRALTLYNAARIFSQSAFVVQLDAWQPPQLAKERQRQFEARALDLLGLAIQKTPPAERAKFWSQVVANDPALRPISTRPEFIRMRAAAQAR